MSIIVTVRDTETGDEEQMEMGDHRYIMVVNEEGGYYVDGEQIYSNGTSIITVKRERS